MLPTKTHLFGLLFLLFLIGHLPTTHLDTRRGHLWPMGLKTDRDVTHPLCHVWEVFCKREVSGGKQDKNFLQTKLPVPLIYFHTKSREKDYNLISFNLSEKKYEMSAMQTTTKKIIQDNTFSTLPKKRKISTSKKLKQFIQQKFPFPLANKNTDFLSDIKHIISVPKKYTETHLNIKKSSNKISIKNTKSIYSLIESANKTKINAGPNVEVDDKRKFKRDLTHMDKSSTLIAHTEIDDENKQRLFPGAILSVTPVAVIYSPPPTSVSNQKNFNKNYDTHNQDPTVLKANTESESNDQHSFIIRKKAREKETMASDLSDHKRLLFSKISTINDLELSTRVSTQNFVDNNENIYTSILKPNSNSKTSNIDLGSLHDPMKQKAVDLNSYTPNSKDVADFTLPEIITDEPKAPNNPEVHDIISHDYTSISRDIEDLNILKVNLANPEAPISPEVVGVKLASFTSTSKDIVDFNISEVYPNNPEVPNFPEVFDVNLDSYTSISKDFFDSHITEGITDHPEVPDFSQADDVSLNNYTSIPRDIENFNILQVKQNNPEIPSIPEVVPLNLNTHSTISIDDVEITPISEEFFQVPIDQELINTQTYLNKSHTNCANETLNDNDASLDHTSVTNTDGVTVYPESTTEAKLDDTENEYNPGHVSLENKFLPNDSLLENVNEYLNQTEIEMKNEVLEINNKNISLDIIDLAPVPKQKKASTNVSIKNQNSNKTVDFAFVLINRTQDTTTGYPTLDWPAESFSLQTDKSSTEVKGKIPFEISTQKAPIYKTTEYENIMPFENNSIFTSKLNDDTDRKINRNRHNVVRSASPSLERANFSIANVNNFVNGSKSNLPKIDSSINVNFYKTENNINDMTKEFFITSTNVIYTDIILDVPTTTKHNHGTYTFNSKMDETSGMDYEQYPRSTEVVNSKSIKNAEVDKKPFIEVSKVIYEVLGFTQETSQIFNSNYMYLPKDDEVSSPLSATEPFLFQTVTSDLELNTKSSIATPELDNKHFTHESTQESIYSPVEISPDQLTTPFSETNNEYGTSPDFIEENDYELHQKFYLKSYISVTPTISQFDLGTIVDSSNDYVTSDIESTLSSSFGKEDSVSLNRNFGDEFNLKSNIRQSSQISSSYETKTLSDNLQDTIFKDKPIPSSITSITLPISNFTSVFEISSEEIELSTFTTPSHYTKTNAFQSSADNSFSLPFSSGNDSVKISIKNIFKIENKINNDSIFFYDEASYLSEFSKGNKDSVYPITTNEHDYPELNTVKETVLFDDNRLNLQSTLSLQFTVNDFQNIISIQEPTLLPISITSLSLRTPNVLMKSELLFSTVLNSDIQDHLKISESLKFQGFLTPTKTAETVYSSDTKSSFSMNSNDDLNIPYNEDRQTEDYSISSASELFPEQNEYTLDSVEFENDPDYLIRTEREVPFSPDDDQSSENENSSDDEIIRTERDLESVNEKYPVMEPNTEVGGNSFQDTEITPLLNSLNKDENVNNAVVPGVEYVSQPSESNTFLTSNQNINPNYNLNSDEKRETIGSNSDISTEFQFGTNIDINTQIADNLDGDIPNINLGTDFKINPGKGNFGAVANSKIGMGNGTLDVKVGGNVTINGQSINVDANVEFGVARTNINGGIGINFPSDSEILTTNTFENKDSNLDNVDNLPEEPFTNIKVITTPKTKPFEKEFPSTPIDVVSNVTLQIQTASPRIILNSSDGGENMSRQFTDVTNTEETTAIISRTSVEDTTETSKNIPTTENDENIPSTSSISDPGINLGTEESTELVYSSTSSSGDSIKTSAPGRNPRDSESSGTSSQAVSQSTVAATTEIPVIPFHFTIDADFDEVVGSRKTEFEDSLTKQLGVAMRVPLECIQNLNVKKGSIEVNFDLSPNSDHGHLADEKALKAAADELKRMIDNGQLNVNDLNGNTLVVIPLDPPTKPPPANAMEHTTLILGVVIGAFILTVVMAAITAIIVKRKSNGDHRLSPIEEARSKLPSYREIQFQEALFMRGPGHHKFILGKYCYDTGQWMGPGPEPMIFEAPESVVYRPPTDTEIRQTPRPTTAVRERLKHDWEVDWDSMVSSR